MSGGRLVATDAAGSNRRALGLFCLYRLIIAALFVLLLQLADLPEPLGIFDPDLFALVAHAYLVAAVVFILISKLRLPDFSYQVAGQVLIDILAITLIMYASAGVSSGFGILLVIVVAGGSLLKPGKIAYFFAAVATIGVLGEELYAQLTRFYPPPNYTHAAVLGVTFFITASISQALAARVRESEALAASRAVDIQNLARLNEQIVQHMQSGVLVLDADLTIRLANNSARHLLGMVGDPGGRDLATLCPELADRVRQWQQQGQPVTTLIQPRAGAVDVQVACRELTSGAGLLVFLEDASMLRQRAQQLKLVSLGRMAASIAHEVRNPLGAISHAGQLLAESGQLTDGDRRLTTIIQDHSRRVNTIVENVMQVSRREASIPQSLRIREWLDVFVADFCQQHELPAEAVFCQVQPEDILVTIDPSQLQQIMMNLCANALRYSRSSPLVMIHCAVHPEMKRPYIDVIDQGPGMPAAIAEHVFEPFVTSESQGTGLGLYIARELCEANQATLKLQANSDRGCCFRINFPHPDKQHSDQSTLNESGQPR